MASHIPHEGTLASWQVKVAEKRVRQQESIPKEWIIPANQLPPEGQLNVISYPERCGLLTPKEILITGLADTTQGKGGVDNLLGKIRDGEWTAVEVTTAFAKRAVIAHQVVNCLTEIFVDDALKQAKLLDDHLQRTGEVVGPLHGLPVSLKDQINVEGVESTMGYVSWIGEVANSDAVLVDILKALGAVPYVKTNVPQTLMWGETFNHVFGRTVNPFNRSLTPGGSSGGEGALIAMKGSPLGIGSDIGGSIRIPAGWCGIYGLRPSFHRIPYHNCRNSLEGIESSPSVLGPMTTELSTIKLFMKAVIGQKPWFKDALTIRKPWSEDEYALSEHGYGKGLCFAIMWDDGRVIPDPPVKRGLQEAKDALIVAGHKVVDWKPIKHYEICRVLDEIFDAGCTEDYETVCAISNEPLISKMTIEGELVSAGVGGHVSRVSSKGNSAYELWQSQKKRTDLRQEYLDWWQRSGEWAETGTGRPVDAIICPMAPSVAPPHGGNISDDYTMIWNALDYPALVIPVSTVDPIKDLKVTRQDFLNDLDRFNYDRYDPQLFKDAPICIQVVGRTLEEEAVVAIGEIVDQALRVA